MVRSDQTKIPAAFIRGGSSKAVFFHEHVLPPCGPLRDRVLKRVMGTPDPLQIDGMGGTKAVTSKIAILSPSNRPDADVDYTFVQVGVSADAIGYDANCGNISAGVGPFAIEEGLVKTFREGKTLQSYKGRAQEVRIFHTGTKKILISHVPIGDDGSPIAAGDYEVSAVPGTGAPILLDYKKTEGASRSRGLLPSGNVVDQVNVQGKEIDITICDIANICIFAKAQDFGISGHEPASTLTEDKNLIALVKELRGKAAQLIGMCEDWEKVDEQAGFMPMPVLIAPAPTSEDHISGRLFLDNMCHESMAGTGSVSFTACSRIKGSVVNKIVNPDDLKNPIFRISHPRGHIPVVVQVSEATANTSTPFFETLSFLRTSRRIMDGHVYVPKTVYDLASSSVMEESTPNDYGLPQSNDGDLRVNGKMNGTNGHAITEEDIPVTKILAEFVASVRPDVLTPQLREKLKEVIIDYTGVVIGGSHNAPSTESIYNGILELGAKATTSGCTVLTKGKGYSAPYAGLLNATFGHSMDFDDTYAEGSLHAGVTAISAALAQAELLGDSTDIDKFLLAIAVGYEITCRLGRELGFDAYSRGFHNTSVAGIFGSIASISVLKGLSSKVVEMAFGLAGSKAAGSMQYLDNGSWNKRLHAGFAVHDAFVCTTLAEAGVVGATRSIEGRFGLLHAYSPRQDKDLARLTYNLGMDWTWLNSALKPFPACRMTHCFIEMAGGMGKAAGNHKEVKSIKLYLTPANYSIVGERTRNKLQPENIVDAQFSAYYQTANAWLYGPNSGLRMYDRLGQPEMKTFCDKIECLVYTEKKQKFASSMEIEYEDGSRESKHMDHPLGEAEHPFTRDQVDLKFLGLVQPVYGKNIASEVIRTIEGIENTSVARLLELLM